MTVADLIEYLNTFPQDAEVQTDKDFEDGMSESEQRERVVACFYFMDGEDPVLFINN